MIKVKIPHFNNTVKIRERANVQDTAAVMRDVAIKESKKVIVYLSLCQGSLRDTRIQFLGNLKCSKLWIIDEADYGAHQPKQVAPIKKAVADDYLLIMTGTNADRAVNNWEEVFDNMGVTYLELLIQKEETRKELENA